MKKLFIFILIGIAAAANAQTEEVHLFFVDYSEQRNLQAGYTSGMPLRMKEEVFKKVKFCQENNWQTSLIIPKETISGIDTLPQQVLNRVKSPPSRDLLYQVIPEFDAVKIRDYLYKMRDQYGRFNSLTLYFFIPEHTSKSIFQGDYNAIRDMLFNEILADKYFSDFVELQVHVSGGNPESSKRSRLLAATEKNIRQKMSFLQTNTDFNKSFNNVLYFNY